MKSSRNAAILVSIVLLAACGEGAGPTPDNAPTAIEAVTAGPLAGEVGTVVPTPITFRVTDSRGTAVRAVPVLFSVNGGSVEPASAFTDDAGHATTQLTLGTTAGDLVLTASVSGTTIKASISASATHGPPSAMRFLLQPLNALTDVEFSPAVQVVVEDTYGNRATTAARTVTLSLANNPTGATLAGTTTLLATDGVAAFTALTVDKPGNGFRLKAAAAGLADVTSGNFDVSGIGRSENDRPDDLSGPQVHVLYVVPSDGGDRKLDANRTLARSVASFHNWFIQQSGGLAFRLDNFGGELDVTFFRLTKTNAQMIQQGAFVVTEIERQLSDAGKLVADKKYLVYYDGGSTHSCGGAAWPPRVPGQVAAMYLQGTPPGASCGVQGFVGSATDFPRYWEFAALHDLVHTLGIVSDMAPHHTDGRPAHVPEQHDLMYSGTAPWVLNSTTTIDVGSDDYFGTAVPPGVASFSGNAILVTVAAALVQPLRPLSPEAAADLTSQMARLPVHPPFQRR